MLETARGHSDGCKALRTNTRTRMSAERGARPGGGSAEDKSQTEAAIVPQGGDVYSVLCFDEIRLSAEDIKRKSRPVLALWHARNSRTRVCGAQGCDFVLVAGTWRFRRLYAVVINKLS